jgi:hypothetical protein
VWLIVLSDQLPVDALVGRYPTNKLIGREPIPKHKSFSSISHARVRGYPVLIQVSLGYPGLRGRLLTCYSPVRRSVIPLAYAAGSVARLACIRHAASVRPEPGSNSPTYILDSRRPGGRRMPYVIVSLHLLCFIRVPDRSIRPKTIRPARAMHVRLGTG